MVDRQQIICVAQTTPICALTMLRAAICYVIYFVCCIDLAYPFQEIGMDRADTI
jgi:hypothetical protein